jgi:hypothetical protein
MAYDDIVLGTAANSKILEVMLRDSTTGAGKTGLAYGDVTYFTIREGTDSTHVHGTCVTMTKDAYADHGFVELDSTNAPGLYQFGVPDACLASGKNAATILLKASGMITSVKRILIMGQDLRAAALSANATQWLGQTIHAATVNGIPVVQIHDSAGAGGVNAPANFEDLTISDTTGLVGTAATQHVIVDSGTVTTVSNQLTAAAIATGVWQDATAGDFSAASSIGKSLYIANVAPGASGGHMISGTNAGTTTLGALTVSGATTLTGAVTGTNASNDLRGISVNMIKDQSVACTTGVTFNANIGTTQPVNFTGTSTSALVKSDTIDWASTAVHAATVNGVPVVQLHDSAGAGGVNAPANFEDLSIVDTTGLVAVPTTQKVDIETIKTRAVTCAGAVAVEANVGTAQPVNFTGTSTSALVKSDAVDWAGTAVHAATVGGVPVVQLHDSAGAGGINAPANFEDLSIVDTTGLVDVTQTAADKAWGTSSRTLSAATNLAGVQVDVTKWDGHAVIAHTVEGAPVVTVKVGTGAATGELDIAAGVVKANVTQVEGTDATDALEAAVDAGLNNAIPGSPAAGSVNDVLKDLDSMIETV